ncbi:hypothetical protein LRD18_09495 [Halorhodospira halochloris]|uniref:hypothetical protein n=1 Tax=Halorhodospira halochloris TaxID=1052 RepID=UPI001EE7B922|nr:hypothetical protein [Halorhodospira halochloris]MCG5531104.1 hypothetical protein [Halorhodospira halochloris]
MLKLKYQLAGWGWPALVFVSFVLLGCVGDSDDNGEDAADSEDVEEEENGDDAPEEGGDNGDNGNDNGNGNDEQDEASPAKLQLGYWDEDGEFRSGGLNFGLAAIGPNGTTSVQVIVFDEDEAKKTDKEGLSVRFSSGCVDEGNASFDEQTVPVVDGIAEDDYTAEGCTEADTITAELKLDEGTIKASSELQILNVGSVVFVEASPEHIGLKSMSSVRETTSNVKFQVLDVYGEPIENERVEFELTPKTGGLELDRTSTITDEQGHAVAQVMAGTVATPVRVIARVQGTQNVAGQSERLWVSTGIPTERGLSLHAQRLNPEGWDCDGEKVEITVRARDRFSNPVIDGTTIYFSTQGGAIEPSCHTENGKCSVEWRSQNPRPVNGRSTILAYTIGEESFIDHTGDGRFGLAEAIAWEEAKQDDERDHNLVWGDTGEVFRDDHEQWFDEPMDYPDEKFTPGVDGIFFDFDGSSLKSQGYDFTGLEDKSGVEFEEKLSDTWTGPNKKFDGVLCKADELEGHEVGCGSDFTGIGVQEVLVMSGKRPFYIDLHECDEGECEPVELDKGANDITFVVRDDNDQPLPAGTEIRLDASVRYYSSSEDGFIVDDLIIGSSSKTVDSTNRDLTIEGWKGEEGVDLFTFTLAGVPNGDRSEETIVLEVETPGEVCQGIQRSRSVTVKRPSNNG